MEQGEKELRKAFEDVTTNNVKTVVEYAKGTREIVRGLETTIERLEKLILSQNEAISALRLQLANVQTKVYSGGTV